MAPDTKQTVVSYMDIEKQTHSPQVYVNLWSWGTCIWGAELLVNMNSKFISKSPCEKWSRNIKWHLYAHDLNTKVVLVLNTQSFLASIFVPRKESGKNIYSQTYRMGWLGEWFNVQPFPQRKFASAHAIWTKGQSTQDIIHKVLKASPHTPPLGPYKCLPHPT